MCIYESARANVSILGFNDPLNFQTNVGGRAFGVDVFIRAAGKGDFRSMGSWAVTAP
jgi:hypothetical protein